MVSISRARKMPGGGVTRSLALDAHGKSAPRCSIWRSSRLYDND
jgi:hypothetical protein